MFLLSAVSEHNFIFLRERGGFVHPQCDRTSSEEDLCENQELYCLTIGHRRWKWETGK